MTQSHIARLFLVIAVASGALSCGTSVGYGRPDSVVVISAPQADFARAKCVAIPEPDTKNARVKGVPVKPGDRSLERFLVGYNEVIQKSMPLPIVPASEVAACNGLVLDLEVWDLYSGEHHIEEEYARQRQMLEQYKPKPNESTSLMTREYNMNASISTATLGAIALAQANTPYSVAIVLRIRKAVGGPPLAEVVTQKAAFVTSMTSSDVAYTAAGVFAAQQTGTLITSLTH
jgi:hypothetical protein